MSLRFLAAGLLCIAATVMLGTQISKYYKVHRELAASLSEIKNKKEAAVKEQVRLGAEMEYYSKPENLDKELRSHFNYHLPGEKMIILVPKTPSTSPAIR